MGAQIKAQTTQPLLDNLKFICQTKAGAHYISQLGIELLHVSQLSSPINTSDPIGSVMSTKSALQARYTKKRRFIPEIVHYQLTNRSFCNGLPLLSLWLIHPSKSLEQQIKNRSDIKESFDEGEVLMVMYSVVSALIGYEGLGTYIDLDLANIFISQTGDIVLSDALLFCSSIAFLKSIHSKNSTLNFSKLAQILQKLMNTSGKIHQYSFELLAFVKLLKEQRFSSYRKISEFIINIRQNKGNELQNQENKSIETKKIDQSQCKTLINALKDYNYDSHNHNFLLSSKINIHNKQNLEKEQVKKLKFEEIAKSMFNRTTPVNLISQNIIDQSFLTEPSPGIERLWTQTEISAIIQFTKTLNSEQTSQYNLLDSESTINRLFGIQADDFTSENRLLWQKNKQNLQNFILKQKNIIMEVAESQMDGTSVNPSRILRLSTLSAMTSSRSPRALTQHTPSTFGNL